MVILAFCSRTARNSDCYEVNRVTCNRGCLVRILALKNAQSKRLSVLAGETRFEHATDGFGDRDSTVELHP